MVVWRSKRLHPQGNPPRPRLVGAGASALSPVLCSSVAAFAVRWALCAVWCHVVILKGDYRAEGKKLHPSQHAHTALPPFKYMDGMPVACRSLPHPPPKGMLPLLSFVPVHSGSS